MNWQRGLKRITLLASIVCAAWAGFYTYQSGTPSLAKKEAALDRMRTEKEAVLARMRNDTRNEVSLLEDVILDGDISRMEDTIRADKLKLLAKISMAGVSGFAAVWVHYALLIWNVFGFVAGSSKGDEEPTPRQPHSPE